MPPSKLPAIRDELRSQRFILTYRDDRIAYVHDCFLWPEGRAPYDYQLEVLGLLDAGVNRIAVRSPHGGGKSALDTWIVLHGIDTREEVKIPTTASAWRQLSEYLWPEIHKWNARTNYDVVNHRDPYTTNELLDLRLKPEGTLRRAFAVACKDAATIEGAHAPSMIYLFDEAKAIPSATWDAAEGAASKEGADEVIFVATSTPGPTAGRFYDIHQRKPGYEDWRPIHWTMEMLISAGAMSEAWAERRRKQWGEDDPRYQNRVLGNFAADDPRALIPLSWVEAAIERWYEWDAAGRPIPEGAVLKIGVDPSGDGGARTAIAKRVTGLGVVSIEYRQRISEMELCGLLIAEANANGFAGVEILVEVGGGYGSGAVSRLREQKCRVTPVNPGSRSDRTDITGEVGFANIRAADWWAIREALDPENGDNWILPPDDRLTADLTIIRSKHSSTGKILMEPKESLEKPDRLGRSPDGGDAASLTLAPMAVAPAFGSSDDTGARQPGARQASRAGLFGDRGGGRLWHS